LQVAFKRIVGLGLCVVDHLYVVDGLDPARTRTRFSERRVSMGGMVATALAQAASLGCNTHILSVLGDDVEGRTLRRSLRTAGIKTGRLVLSSSLPTTVAVILVEQRTGERRFVVPDRRPLERRAPALDLSLIDRNTLLLVDGHFPDQALRAVKRARECGATVIADFHLPRPAVRRLLPYVDYPIVPLEFVQAGKDSDPHRALRRLADRHGGCPVVTLGSRGGLYLKGRRVRRFRAHPTRVRDTTGAGDVFHGAFAAALYNDLDFELALDLAARAAARSCTALGGTGRLMTRAELRRFLAGSGAGSRRGR
jgi:sulfofructose kinase